MISRIFGTIYKTFKQWESTFNPPLPPDIASYCEKSWKAGREYPERKIERAVEILKGEMGILDRVSKAIEILEEK